MKNASTNDTVKTLDIRDCLDHGDIDKYESIIEIINTEKIFNFEKYNT